MPTLQDILDILEQDDEVQKLASAETDTTKATENTEAVAATTTETTPAATTTEATKEAMPMGVPMPADAGEGGEGTDMAAAAGDQHSAGSMATDGVANTLSDNQEDQRIKVQGQLEEMAAAQVEAKAMPGDDGDELPAHVQRPVIGEMINLGDTQKPMDKAAVARAQVLVDLGLEKEAEIRHEKLAEENYLCGQIFGRGVKDYMEGRESAFQKEASVLDTMENYTKEQVAEAMNALTDEEVTKIGSLLEDRKEQEKLASTWYNLGIEYGRGIQDTSGK